ncbi:UNVERIFIED_CONTAM: hypothetical protein GTU68_035719 [Idotea baltica]|nr:hypothetical protein [Idotea baltica]
MQYRKLHTYTNNIRSIASQKTRVLKSTHWMALRESTLQGTREIKGTVKTTLTSSYKI